MTDLSHMAQAGALSRLPVIGFIARDLERDINVIFYMLMIVVTAVALAMMKWGLVALALTAVALVPVIFVILFLITLG